MSADKSEKRMMSITITVHECTQAQGEAIMKVYETMAQATADTIVSPVQIMACPPNAPMHIQRIATRIYHPESRPCPCAHCAKGEPKGSMMPLSVPMGPRGPEYPVTRDALLEALELVEQESRARDDNEPATETPAVNVPTRGPRGPVS